MKKQRKQPKPGKIVFAVLFGILFLLGVTILSLSVWYSKNFGVSFKEFIYTVLSPLKGTGEGTVVQIVNAALPYVIAAAALYILICIPLFLREPIRRIVRDIKLKRKNRTQQTGSKTIRAAPRASPCKRCFAESAPERSFCCSSSRSPSR